MRFVSEFLDETALSLRLRCAMEVTIAAKRRELLYVARRPGRLSPQPLSLADRSRHGEKWPGTLRQRLTAKSRSRPLYPEGTIRCPLPYIGRAQEFYPAEPNGINDLQRRSASCLHADLQLLNDMVDDGRKKSWTNA